MAHWAAMSTTDVSSTRRAPLRLGAVFPQTEIGTDPAAIRAYVEAVEAAGYDYLCVFDHVLGANPNRPGGWSGPYTHETPFHEVMVLLGWIAALTTRLELVTEVLVLPQRQTALVAKQATEIAILSGGRLRLGIGIGWNAVEYESLGMDFRDRGRRVEEQIEVMRRLWREPLVRFQGRWHSIPDAGLNPLPPGGSIPLWMGGTADPALRRAARLAEGWMSTVPVGEALEGRLAVLRSALAEAGRDPERFGIAGRVAWRGDRQAVLADLDRWREVGATHCSVNTMGAGLGTPADHAAVLADVADAWRARQG